MDLFNKWYESTSSALGVILGIVDVSNPLVTSSIVVNWRIQHLGL